MLPLSRIIAALLAIGGTIWGVLLMCVFGPVAILIPPFLFGYLLTVGYWYRAVIFPSRSIRCNLWIASIAVQGLWLAVGFKETDGFIFWWWVCAIVASIVALICEPSNSEPKES